MTRIERMAVVVVLMTALAFPVAAADLGRVTGYLGSTARTYDEFGQPTGERSTKELPVNVPVEKIDGKGHIVVKKGEKVFYLKASDLVISGAPTCKTLVVSNNAYETHVTASAGVHAGAAETAVPCTH